MAGALSSAAKVESALVALAAFFLFFGALFARAGDSDHVIAGGDAAYYFLPLFQEEPTDWVETSFGGYPAFADPQGLRNYPVARLMRAAGASFNQFTISAFVLASWFAFLAVFLATGSRAGGAVAGLAYATSSFFFVHLVHVSMLHTAAWLAASVLCVTQFAATRSRFWFGGLCLAVGLMVLAGSPQLAFYGGGLVGLVALGECVQRRDARLLAIILGAFALGLGLCAVQVIPASELFRFTPRAALTLDDFVSNAMQLRYLPALALPTIFAPWSGPVPGPDDFDLQITLSLVAVGFAAVGCVRGPLRRQSLLLGALAVVSFLLSLRPVAQWFFSVPGYNLFRGPSRHLLNFSLLISLAGGLGVARVAAEGWRLRPRDLLAPLLVVGLVLLPLTRLPLPGGVPWLGAGIGLFVAFGVLVLLTVTRMPGALAAGLVVVACLGDTLFTSRKMGWETWAPPASVAQLSPEVLQLASECRRDGCRLLAWSGYWSSSLPGALARAWEVPSLAGYNVLSLSRLGSLLWMDPNGVVLEKARLIDPKNQTLRLLGVRYLLTGTGDKVLLEREGFTPAGMASIDFAYRAASSSPRAWLTTSALRVEEDQATRLIRGEETLADGTPFDPDRVALMLDEGFGLTASGPSTGTLETLEASPGLLRLKTRTQAPSVLVANLMHYPGWRAFIDGVEVPVGRANVVQLAVRVDAPGEHEVRFEFLPRRKRWGQAASALAAMLLAGVLLLWGRTTGARK